MELKTEGWKKETSRELRDVYSCCFKAPGIASQQVCTELPTNCVTFFREALSIPSRFLVT